MSGASLRRFLRDAAAGCGGFAAAVAFAFALSQESAAIIGRMGSIDDRVSGQGGEMHRSRNPPNRMTRRNAGDICRRGLLGIGLILAPLAAMADAPPGRKYIATEHFWQGLGGTIAIFLMGWALVHVLSRMERFNGYFLKDGRADLKTRLATIAGIGVLGVHLLVVAAPEILTRKFGEPFVRVETLRGEIPHLNYGCKYLFRGALFVGTYSNICVPSALEGPSILEAQPYRISGRRSFLGYTLDDIAAVNAAAPPQTP